MATGTHHTSHATLMSLYVPLSFVESSDYALGRQLDGTMHEHWMTRGAPVPCD